MADSVQLSASSVLRRADRTAWQSFDSRVVVLDVPSRTLVGLNPTATQIWNQLDGLRSLEDIASALAQAYQQPLERVRDEVVTFGEQLLSRGCVEQVFSAAGELLTE